MKRNQSRYEPGPGSLLVSGSPPGLGDPWQLVRCVRWAVGFTLWDWWGCETTGGAGVIRLEWRGFIRDVIRRFLIWIAGVYSLFGGVYSFLCRAHSAAYWSAGMAFIRWHSFGVRGSVFGVGSADQAGTKLGHP